MKVFYQVLKILVSLGPFMYVSNFDLTSNVPSIFNLHLASSNSIRRFISYEQRTSCCSAAHFHLLLSATVSFLSFSLQVSEPSKDRNWNDYSAD